MAGEGVYPKVNGDILYASEVNTFTKFLGVINGPASCQGTSLVVGSILIPANKIGSAVFVLGQFWGRNQTAGGATTVILTSQLGSPYFDIGSSAAVIGTPGEYNNGALVCSFISGGWSGWSTPKYVNAIISNAALGSVFFDRALIFGY